MTAPPEDPPSGDARSEGRQSPRVASQGAPGCSFCGKRQHEVRRLIAGPEVHICNECLDLCVAITNEEETEAPAIVDPAGAVADRRALRASLDELVVGQEAAKRALVAAWHERALASRVSARMPRLLLVGPGGCGKTMVARALARHAVQQTHIADAGRLTEGGYAGQDVEWLLQGLLETDSEAARSGVLVLDGIEKIRAERPTMGGGGGRDVSGEGVQRELMFLLDGNVLHVPPRGGGYRTAPTSIDTSGVLVVGLLRAEGTPPELTTEAPLRAWLRGRGFLAAFVSRFDRVVWMPPLTAEEAERVLVAPLGPLSQSVRVAGLLGATLDVAPEAARALAVAASASEDGGWLLRQVAESLLEDVLVADDAGRTWHIGEDTVLRLIR